MTDFNHHAPRFKVGDKISWHILMSGTQFTDHGFIEGIIWGRFMEEPIYRTGYDVLIPESLIIAPKTQQERVG